MRRAVMLWVLSCWLQGGCAESRPPVKVTYLANEGFLIEVGSSKVLIDAFFDDPTIDYCHVHTQDTLARLQRSDPPFDGVDLILVTHGHRDHFAPGPLLEHLARDQGSRMVGPAQAIQQLRLERSRSDSVANRVTSLDLEMFESSQLAFGTIRLQAHRVHHSQFMEQDHATGQQVNRHAGVQNLAYLLEFEGVKVLHVGDAVLPLNREYLESERFPEGKIDIVFLEFFDWDDETIEILAQRMTPDHVVFMHFPPQKEQIEKLTAHLSERFPNAVVFQEPLEVRFL